MRRRMQLAVAGLVVGMISSAVGPMAAAEPPDGEVRAWGANHQGAGDVPEDLGPVRDVAANFHHSLALDISGQVHGWGYNYYGQVDVPDDLGQARAIDTAATHSVALETSGDVQAWGDNHHGQLDVPDDLDNATAIAAGDGHTLALDADGQVHAWGNNAHGQLDVPNDLNNATAIASDGHVSMAIDTDGQVHAWGNNAHGQLDVPDDLDNAIEIDAGITHSVALEGDGQVHAWGKNNDGKTDVPEDLGPASAVATGRDHSLATEQEQPAPLEVHAPENDSEVSGDDVEASGAGDPGARVTVELNGSQVDTTEVDQGGDWAADVGDLDVGEHTITATQHVDGEQPESDTVTVHVYPTESVSFVLPEDGETVDANGASVQIFGEPDANVEVTVGDEVVGSGTIPHGDDLLLDLSELPTGEQTLTATQTVDGEDEVTTDTLNVIVKPGATTR
ncbi:MAG TPA: hypothetical protein VK053_20295 [Jiangellaceae bacterium]|nr:hypothetical protein [Jiangellaceae bacterium]